MIDDDDDDCRSDWFGSALFVIVRESIYLITLFTVLEVLNITVLLQLSTYKFPNYLDIDHNTSKCNLIKIHGCFLELIHDDRINSLTCD